MSLAVVQHKSAVRGFEQPGSITLTSAPTAGNLLVVILGCNIATANITVSGSWTKVPTSEFTSAGVSTGMMLYRYAQLGDTAALPALWTAGTSYWAYSAFEISGVSGVFANDTGAVHIDGHGTTGTVTSLAPASVTSAASSLILGGGMMYNGAADPTLSAGWTQDEVGHNNANYGSLVGGHDTGNTTTALTVSFTTASDPAYAAMFEIKVPASTETGTAGMAFGGIGFSASGSVATVAHGAMAFGGVAFSAAGAAIVTGTGAMAFAGPAFVAVGLVEDIGTAGLAFGAIAIRAYGADMGATAPLENSAADATTKDIIQSLTWNIPIADASTGNPTPEMQRKWSRLMAWVQKQITLNKGAVTKNYVDQQDLSILYAAQTYADSRLLGTAGSTWYTGHGVPSVGLGIDGDFYLDVDTGDVYEKEAGTWL